VTLPLGRFVAPPASIAPVIPLTLGRFVAAAFKVRYVRTPAGAKRYGVPIGSPIPIGRQVKPKGGGPGTSPQPAGGQTPGAATGPKVPLNDAERDIAERHFGRSDEGADGKDRGAVVDPDSTLRVADPKKAAGVLDRIARNPDNDLTDERRTEYRNLRDRVSDLAPKAEPEPEATDDPAPADAPGWDHPTPAPNLGSAQRTQDALLQDWRTKISETTLAERRAVSDYTGTGFIGMNERLRHGTGGGTNTDQHIEALTSLANRYTTPGRITAYRFTHNDGLPEGATVGDVVTEPGFTSTSIESANLRPEFSNRAIRMQIAVPAGMHAVNVNGVSGGIAAENEMILPPGTRYRIVEDEMRGGQRWVTMEALPPVPT
jgi:hypothetical protein